MTRYSRFAIGVRLALIAAMAAFVIANPPPLPW